MKKIYYLFLLLSMNLSFAQENIQYQQPSESILQLADFQKSPAVIMDAKGQWLLLVSYPTYQKLEDLNQEEIRLAGLRINPKLNVVSNLTYANDLKLQRIDGNNQSTSIQIKNLPANPKIAYIRFSSDDKHITFTHTTEQGVELWIVDVASATARRLGMSLLNANLGFPYTWANDGKCIIARTLLKNRSALRSDKKQLPTGPIVSEGTGKTSQNRTYQDLLKNETDEFNFQLLATSELKKIDLHGNETLYKEAGMYIEESFSSDSNYLLITQLKKPFSYIVPYYRFPMVSNVYDLDGNWVANVNEVPLTEILPKGFSSVRLGKRSLRWRADQPHSLYFVEAIDDGDQYKEATFRDVLYSWKAPFNEQPQELMKLTQRFQKVIWGNKKQALVYDSWYDTRNQKIYLLNPESKTHKLMLERNYQDRYNDPGTPQTSKNKWNRYVLQIDNNKTYWLASGYTPKGQFPFLEEVDLNNFKKKRLYTSHLKDKKESIIELLNPQKGELLVNIQSPDEYPNYYIKNYKNKRTTQLTHFENPFKALKGIHKEVIHYKRKDGVALSGTLYLPKNYDFDKKEKLPLLIWAYPKEFNNRNTAGQNTANANEFTYPYYGSFVYWVTKGYAVLDDAAFPIVGEEGKEPNDTFIEQLIANAQAAIDAVDELGYIDRKKVAIGGHSYGAFMTANLLTHSDLFVCGIARSGAYNRTLTPFGFQHEQRNYWDAPEVYNTMSPFMNAHKMKRPMLLIHGDADNNSGTFTFQTERYFQALKNLGAPVRMVLLPLESHGYKAKESILHTLWEQDVFLEKHLKNTEELK